MKWRPISKKRRFYGTRWYQVSLVSKTNHIIKLTYGPVLSMAICNGSKEVKKVLLPTPRYIYIQHLLSLCHQSPDFHQHSYRSVTYADMKARQSLSVPCRQRFFWAKLFTLGQFFSAGYMSGYIALFGYMQVHTVTICNRIYPSGTAITSSVRASGHPLSSARQQR